MSSKVLVSMDTNGLLITISNITMAVTVLTVFRTPLRPFGLLAMLLLLSSPLQAAGITIEKASTQYVNDSYLLNADIKYELSDEVLEALNNGVTITMQLVIKIERKRSFLWDESIASLVQRHELKYHALSGQYLINSLNNGKQQSYLSLDSALRRLGRIHRLPILDTAPVDATDNMVVQLYSELDTNALPAPLRPVAWMSNSWKLSSEWFSCPLKS